MRTFRFLFAVLTGLTLLITACGAGTTIPPTVTVALEPVQISPQAGDKAPDITLTDNEGDSVQLSVVAAEHKSTVLVFYLSHT